ncbi:MAG: PD-(D/E)XK nuclease family transposase [Bacteroidaceae bacterium]|nr:PD-(D/E)XK nuclease family transposase [Bacteroidaceae bacterium]
MSKFINPFTDVGFKRIFGQEISKPVLITFLNTLLEGEYCIANLKYLDKEQLGIADNDRSLIYDIYCELEDGGHIIVEMQNKSQPFFKNRSIYYISRSIAMQGERGAEWEYNVKATILVAFLNFHQKDISTDFRTDVSLMDMRHKTPFSDRMRLIYLQLPLFQKELEECATVFEQMIYVLKHMDVLQRMPELLQNAVFQKIASIAEVASLSHEDRIRYDASIRHFRDTIAVMEGQYEEGMKQGMEQANIDMARKMKALGADAAFIAKVTSLAAEQIQRL